MSEPKLVRMFQTPAVMRWIETTGLSEHGAQVILDYARDQVQWAAGEGAEPYVAIQAAIASMAAMLNASSFEAREKWSAFIADHFRLIEPAVRDHIALWNPDRAQDEEQRPISTN